MVTQLTRTILGTSIRKMFGSLIVIIIKSVVIWDLLEFKWARWGWQRRLIHKEAGRACWTEFHRDTWIVIRRRSKVSLSSHSSTGCSTRSTIFTSLKIQISSLCFKTTTRPTHSNSSNSTQRVLSHCSIKSWRLTRKTYGKARKK